MADGGTPVAFAWVALVLVSACGRGGDAEPASPPTPDRTVAVADAGVPDAELPPTCKLAAPVVVAADRSAPQHVAVGRRYLYWIEAMTTIVRVPVEGGGVETFVPPAEVRSVVAEGDYLVYVTPGQFTVVHESDWSSPIVTAPVATYSGPDNDVLEVAISGGVVAGRTPNGEGLVRRSVTGKKVEDMTAPPSSAPHWFAGGGGGGAFMGEYLALWRAPNDANGWERVPLAPKATDPGSTAASASHSFTLATRESNDAPAVMIVSVEDKAAGTTSTIDENQFGALTQAVSSPVVANDRLYLAVRRGATATVDEILSMRPDGSDVVVAATARGGVYLATDGAHLAWIDQADGRGDIHVACVR